MRRCLRRSAAPLLEATTAPYARGLRDIRNCEADAYLGLRVAQFRVEIRLAAETIEAWCRVPAGWCAEGIALLARGGIFIYEMALISLAIQIGLALPMVVYFHRISFTGLTANVIIVPLLGSRGADWIPGDLHWMARRRGARGVALENCRAHCRLARAPGTGVAGFQSSAMAGAQFRGVVDLVRGGDAQRSLAQAHGRAQPAAPGCRACSDWCCKQPWTRRRSPLTRLSSRPLTWGKATASW